jgi:bifunctional N-acetylglucosamine-1-phosphate-uridyltransferase/glucosamine-1-phosphate-acetyltransferase GlmU-like protein
MKAQIPFEIDASNWRESAAAAVDPSQWTAIVPAAGRGSRLGYDLPKILYPVAGRPVLEWLLDFLEPNCSRLVFVLSPDGAAPVRRELDRLVAGRYDVAIQATPKGMGDAVERALPAVKTPHVAIVWGDQVALRRSSVEACLRVHAGVPDAALTCPTVFRDHPYIHFERDATGQISALRQAREGDLMPERGESDTGFFCLRTGDLRRLLAQLREMPGESGRSTGEFNFLPLIPLAARQGLTVLTPRLMTIEETVGINSAEDARAVEVFLRDTDACTERQSR